MPDWESWLNEHGPRLMLYARQRTRNMADAEDVLQNALIELLRVTRKGEFRRSQEQWVAYVIRCIRTKAIDLGKASARQLATAMAAAQEAPTRYTEMPWLTSTMDTRFRQQCSEKVLREMRPDYAEGVILHIWESLPFREIATILNENPATIATRYRAALRLFRQNLEHEINRPE